MNILFLDTETTGLSPQKHRIIEIGAALYLDYAHNNPIAKFHEDMGYFNFDLGEVSLGATAVNLIHPESLSPGNGRMQWKDALHSFLNFLIDMKTNHKDFVVCGQNPKFDYDFLEASCNRMGIEGIESLLGRYPIDVGVIGRTMQLLGLRETAPNAEGWTTLERIPVVSAILKEDTVDSNGDSLRGDRKWVKK